MKNAKKAEYRAPGKLILMGEHSVVYGHPCMVTAVDTCIQVFAEVSQSENDVVHAPQVKNIDYVQKSVDVFRNTFGIEDRFNISTNADSDNIAGLGSSSAVTVAVFRALMELYDLDVEKKEVFKTCFDIVKNVQGSGSGADVAAATFGGTLYYSQLGEVVQKIDGSGMNIVIGNSGVKASTKNIVQRVSDRRLRERAEVERIFQAITDCVERGKKHLLNGQFSELGKEMNENHKLLQELDVSTAMLDKLIEVSCGAGAYGAKLSGAGGGDNMFALVSDEARVSVEKAIENASGKVVRVATNYAI